MYFIFRSAPLAVDTDADNQVTGKTTRSVWDKRPPEVHGRALVPVAAIRQHANKSPNHEQKKAHEQTSPRAFVFRETRLFVHARKVDALNPDREVLAAVATADGDHLCHPPLLNQFILQVKHHLRRYAPSARNCFVANYRKTPARPSQPIGSE